MTVVLVGVGADSGNTDPVPRIDAEGNFEYIPIPETWPTTEQRTYGNYDLRNHSGTAIDFVDRISPKSDGNWITDDEEIASHPVHFDPNLDALTYGDKKGTGGKGTKLVDELDAGDILSFYTGLEDEDGRLHRYIYGYFTVETVDDLTDLSGAEYHEGLRRHPENAHTKRLEGAGEPKHEDLVVIDGTEPGGLLDKAYPMTEWLGKPPWYRLSPEFVEEFNARDGPIAVSRKMPVVLDIETGRFIDKIYR